jgi:hypothetical protein
VALDPQAEMAQEFKDKLFRKEDVASLPSLACRRRRVAIPPPAAPREIGEIGQRAEAFAAISLVTSGDKALDTGLTSQ